jgi:hypothetical protein
MVNLSVQEFIGRREKLEDLLIHSENKIGVLCKFYMNSIRREKVDI